MRVGTKKGETPSNITTASVQKPVFPLVDNQRTRCYNLDTAWIGGKSRKTSIAMRTRLFFKEIRSPFAFWQEHIFGPMERKSSSKAEGAAGPSLSIVRTVCGGWIRKRLRRIHRIPLYRRKRARLFCTLPPFASQIGPPRSSHALSQRSRRRPAPSVRTRIPSQQCIPVCATRFQAFANTLKWEIRQA